MIQPILKRHPPPADGRIRYGDDPNQFADLRMPDSEGPHPCVIAIHGGFWRNAYSLDHLGHLCAALKKQGTATWNTEYRRVGDEGGGWPGTFEDVMAAARYVFDHASEIGIDPDRVIVLGHSAGGQLASWLGSVENVPANSVIRADPLDFRGVVSLGGVLDLRAAWKRNLSNGAVADLLGGTPDDVPECYDAASPIDLVPSRVPHLLVHGEDDEIVPVSMSDSYHAAAISAGGRSKLLILPGAEHFDVIDPEVDFWPETLEGILTWV